MKKNALIISLIMVVGVFSGCKNSEHDQKINLAKNEIKDSLIDPGSVQFKNGVLGFLDDGTSEVCIDVNAKNKMGGYTGFSTHLCTIINYKGKDLIDCVSRSYAVSEMENNENEQRREISNMTHLSYSDRQQLLNQLIKGSKEIVEKFEMGIINKCDSLREKKDSIKF